MTERVAGMNAVRCANQFTFKGATWNRESCGWTGRRKLHRAKPAKCPKCGNNVTFVREES